jgi:DNA-binding LacI/PurR family transcriptional regulator
MSRTAAAGLGRSSRKLAGELGKRIRSGKLAAGDYLPTVRELCSEHSLSIDTVSRALKSLEAEGLIAAEPRQGYRVLARAGDPLQGHPVAYVPAVLPEGDESRGFHQMLGGAFQRAAAERGWSLLGVSASEATPAQIMEQLKTARVFGAVLDSMNRELLALVERAGMPAVMVDAWEEHTNLDVVTQDNYRGGFLAAEHLVEKGHQRVAWFGPVGDSPLSRERFGGACAAMAAAGLPAPQTYPLDFPGGLTDEERRERARKLLATEHRPRAVLALWGPLTAAVVAAARGLGMVPGRDLDVVGWAPEQAYREVFAAAFERPEDLPAAVVWSAEDMARTAVARLAQRRENPELPPLRINVPTRLQLPRQEQESEG